MSASIDRFLATGDAAKKKKAKALATMRRVGLRCTNCGGSHNTRSYPYEKKGGGLHNEDGTNIRTCSVCHRPGHTELNCPELSNCGTHNVPDELPDGWDERGDRSKTAVSKVYDVVGLPDGWDDPCEMERERTSAFGDRCAVLVFEKGPAVQPAARHRRSRRRRRAPSEARDRRSSNEGEYGSSV